MRLNHDRQIDYYYGSNKFVKVWQQRSEMWSSFAARLMSEVRTPETMAEWKTMADTRKDFIKDVGGFVGGLLKDGKRTPANVLERTLITLDADAACPELWDTFTMLYECAAVMYQTHSWRPEKHKIRLVLPLSRSVEPMLFKAISVHIADELGEPQFDHTTHQTNRLMFMPSLPIDAPHEPKLQDGPFFDVDAWVEAHPRWMDISTWPVSSREVEKNKKQVEKLGDPRLKPGIIGAFCRVYDIPLAIETFIPDKYLPGSSEDRYTWAEGSTSNGVIVYDDGLHIYTNHGTDPCGNVGSCVNAWDMVRIHLFGEDDKTKMYELAESDPLVMDELEAERGRAADVFMADGVANPRLMFFRIEGKQTIFTPKYVGDWYRGLQPVVNMNGELYRYEGGRYIRAEQHFTSLVTKALDVEFTGHRLNDSLRYLLGVAPVMEDPFGGERLINVRNGLLDTVTGTLHPHDPSHFCTVQIPWDYNPDAECPTVDSFLHEYAEDHAELVWHMMGYSLMPTMRHEKAFILLGAGGNGKGTTLELMTKLLGAENTSNVPLQTLESNRFAASSLVGKLANIQSDLPNGLLEAHGKVKQIVSGDRIEVERKNRDSFSTYVRAKLMFSANELPQSADTSEGFFRRWCIIPYNKEFRDREMRSRLFDEIPGVLAKAVRYAIDLHKLDSFPSSGDVKQYRIKSDSVYAFIDERCYIDPEGQVPKGDMYDAYKTYCFFEGSKPVSSKRFSSKFSQITGATEHRTSKTRGWVGVKIVTDGDSSILD